MYKNKKVSPCKIPPHTHTHTQQKKGENHLRERGREKGESERDNGRKREGKNQHGSHAWKTAKEGEHYKEARGIREERTYIKGVCVLCVCVRKKKMRGGEGAGTHHFA